MASSETDESEKRESVSTLVKRAAIESTEIGPSQKPHGHMDTTVNSTEHKSVEIVNKSDDFNVKMQLMMNNANPDNNIQQIIYCEIQENANIEVRRLRHLEEENAIINMQKQGLEDEMQRLQQQNSIMAIENENLHKKNIDKDNQIENLWQEINNQDNEIQQLRQENSRIEQEKDDKDNEIRNLQQENDSKNNEIQQLQQGNTRIEQENENKDNEIRNLQQKNDNKNNEIQQLRQQNSEKNNIIKHLQKENKTKDNEILQVRNENQQRFQEIQEKNIGIRRHEQDIAAKNNEILRLQQEIEKNTKFVEKSSVVILNEELGRGGYGTVYKGDFYGTKVAVKEYYQVILSNYNRKVLTRELNIASQCRHPNLLQFICASENDQHHLLIVTELLDMTLRTLIEQRAEAQSPLSSQDVQSISLDVARGLNYLHSKKPDPIIHRDISSSNVLLSITNGVVVRAKISDYGSANFMELCNTRNPGAAIYAAPEAGSSQQDP